jgi:hypothetical protein
LEDLTPSLILQVRDRVEQAVVRCTPPSQGEVPKIPRSEGARGPGSTGETGCSIPMRKAGAGGTGQELDLVALVLAQGVVTASGQSRVMILQNLTSW